MRSPQKNNRARGRGRSNKSSGGNSANRVYESTGPEGKVRGTPQQIFEKYLSLARDAQTSGDRVVAENFLQHAEHYQRILIQAAASQPAQDPRRDEQPEMGQQQDRGRNNDGDQEDDIPQPTEAKVDGLTTIDAEGPDNGNLIIGADEMSTSQPAKTRKTAAEMDIADEPGELAPSEQQA